MRAWTVDADDIQIADDLDATLLHRTAWIDRFLDQKRGDQFIVTATKGFGKTLLLKAKRIAYGASGATVCIPEHGLLDKPIGDKVFSTVMLELYGKSTDNWRRIWLTAIAAATLKRLELTDGLRVSPPLHALLTDSTLRGVVDHFVNLLDLSRGDLFKVANDTDNQLVPRLRGLDTPVAIFVDSIDEYFNKHLASGGTRASVAGEVSPTVWYYAQMGLVEVAYQLRRITHQLKVFAAVRKEAFSRFDELTPMGQQYRGSTIDIVYATESLHEIFLNNIRREGHRNLVEPSRLKTDPVRAFVGVSHLVHGHTGDREGLLDYITRHTLRRPRDFMTIGRQLSDTSPEQRRREDTLKRVVNDAATAIAREYLNEIRPYVGDLDLDRLLGLIDRNVLRPADVERITAAYVGGGSGAPADPFGVLRRAGLLGWVDVDHVTRTTVQRFLLPGERSFDRDDPLPRSSHYLIHPILVDIIAERNPRFVENIDRINVVGAERGWRGAVAADEDLCAVRADICGFSAFMLGDEGEARVVETLRRALERRHHDCVLCEVHDGDAFIILHVDPRALLSIVRGIQVELYETCGAELRVAIDLGTVGLERDPKGNVVGILRGQELLRNVARIEPVVERNQVWVTARFKEALDHTTSFYRAAPIEPELRPEVRAADGAFNVRKPGSTEPDQFVTLYRIVEPPTARGSA